MLAVIKLWYFESPAVRYKTASNVPTWHLSAGSSAGAPQPGKSVPVIDNPISLVLDRVSATVINQYLYLALDYPITILLDRGFSVGETWVPNGQ